MESQGVPLPLVVHGDQYQAPVHISAGGTNYTTTLATLTSLKDSKLGKLFNGTLPITLDPINHHYFLDTDGSVFAHTLNFLRYGELVLPDDFSQRPLLLKQARQLEIEPLVEALKLSEEENDQDESKISEAEDGTTPHKKTESRCRRKRVHEVKEEPDNLVSRQGEGVEGFIAELKQKEKDRQEVDERMCNLMKKLDDTLQALRVDNDNRVETTNKENDKGMKEDEKIVMLMKGLGDTLEKLMVDNGSNIEKMIKLQDQRQKEKERQGDERMCNLTKKLDDTLQALRVDNDSRLQIENEDKRRREDEQMDKLMKGLAKISSSNPNAEGLHRPVIVVVHNEQYVEQCEKWSGQSTYAYYKIQIMGTPYDNIKLVLPNVSGIRTEKKGDVITWKYSDISCQTWIVVDITSQLTIKGYQLITDIEYTAEDKDKGHPRSRVYSFIHSS